MRTNSTNSRRDLIAENNQIRKKAIDELLTLAKPQGMNNEEVIERTESVERFIGTVAMKPWQKGFSDSDLSFHAENMRGRIRFNKERIAELKKADEDLIKSVAWKLHGLSSKERESHPVMKDHRSINRQIHSREAFIERAFGAIEVLETELGNRKDRVAEQRAEIARRHEQWKAQHEEILREQRRSSTKLKKRAKKTAPKVARSEVTLKGFQELRTLNRRKGIFTTELSLKKAEVAERLGGIDQLSSAFEEAKTKGTNVLHVFEDGRQIVTKKAGAVTRYFERT
jgi:chromosome segregation ATPase